MSRRFVGRGGQPDRAGRRRLDALLADARDEGEKGQNRCENGCLRTFCNVHSVPGESCAAPYQATLSWKKRGYLPADQLVTDGLLAMRIQFISVGNLPRAAGCAIIVRHGFLGSGEFCLFRVECISMLILPASYLSCATSCIDLEDGIVWSIDIGIDAETKQMLVVMRVNSWVDLRTPTMSVLSWIHGIGVEDSC